MAPDIEAHARATREARDALNQRKVICNDQNFYFTHILPHPDDADLKKTLGHIIQAVVNLEHDRTKAEQAKCLKDVCYAIFDTYETDAAYSRAYDASEGITNGARAFSGGAVTLVMRAVAGMNEVLQRPNDGQELHALARHIFGDDAVQTAMEEVRRR